MEDSRNQANSGERVRRDFALLIRKLRDQVSQAPAPRREWTVSGPDQAERELAPFLAGRDPDRAAVVTADRTGLELGPPRLPSLDVFMTTSGPEPVSDGRITLLGSDLADLPGSAAFMQAVIVALPGPDPDRLRLENARFLIRQVPGYMVRSVPGRLWARIDRELLAAGFSFFHLGCALYRALHREGSVAACEVVFAAGEADLVRSFEELARQAQVLARDNRKLILDPDGAYSCVDLDCEKCDERPYCDELRDLIKYRRERKRT